MSLGANLFRFSIAVAMSMHAAANARGCLIENLATGAQQRIPGAWIWTISALLVPAAIMLVTRGRLGAPREVSGNSESGRTTTRLVGTRESQ